TAHQVEQNWEQIKMKEKDGNKSILSGVPGSLPELIKAYRIQQKAATAGFDWDDRQQVWHKVKEEIDEFSKAVESARADEIEEEMGDLFFSLVNAARLYDVIPENALEKTNRKFIARFNYIEQKARQQGRRLPDLTLAEMDAMWNEAKTALRDGD
ncbi:MAG: MazG family protein, partial [Muribaculaceae bacterium]|nr:MazG family protein [Muribaculaceae bacterium]